MVLRKIPGRNWGTKLSTFSLVLLSGVEEIFRQSRESITTQIRVLYREDSPLIPARWKYPHQLPKTSVPIRIRELSEDDIEAYRYYLSTKILKSIRKD
jgi:hypothetical protein